MRLFVFLAVIVVLSDCSQPDRKDREFVADQKIDYRDEAIRLSRDLIIVDTHIDVPYRLESEWEDISTHTQGGHFDYERAVAGGLNAPFMSIYIPARFQRTGGARDYADRLMDMVYGFAEKWPDKFQIAINPDEIKDQFIKGLISLPMGMENGAAIENDLSNVKYFYDRGIRYITLTHSKWNQICDSSYDPDKHWNGLSPFGRELIVEMNRVGMMIDISHVSDSSFYQVMELSNAPVIASHSSCRYYTPGFERNMSDDMIQVMAEKGGVIMINFGAFFLDGDFQRKMQIAYDHIDGPHRKWRPGEKAEYIRQYKIDNQIPEVTLDDVIDHINHVVAHFGIDHVGLGSDFDGVDEVPEGFSDVSMYPNLIERLLEDGYTEPDIRKICSENIFRVWQEVEEIAANRDDM